MMKYVFCLFYVLFPICCFCMDALSEANSFFSNIHDGERNHYGDYSRRICWEERKGNKNLQSLTLDSNGRINLLKKIKGEKCTNFSISIRNFPMPKKSYKLQSFPNPKYWITTYIFEHVDIEGKKIGKPYIHIKKGQLCSGCNAIGSYKCNWGLLNDFLNPQFAYGVNYFAKNVLRIFKISNKPLLVPSIKRRNRLEREYIADRSIQVALMILTTERLRSEQALLISYIEFYKLKHASYLEKIDHLREMFDPDNPSLKFPKKEGGARAIVETEGTDLCNRFLDMLRYSPVYSNYSSLSENVQKRLKNEFLKDKLDTLNYIIYGKHTKLIHTFKCSVVLFNLLEHECHDEYNSDYLISFVVSQNIMRDYYDGFVD